MARIVAVIPARGGSKGIPRKNLIPLCGKPLVAWSIEQARAAGAIESVWVTSDSDEILDVSRSYGARGIRRPDEIAGDTATSESAWLHAVDEIERQGGPVDIVVGMQATSPVREAADLQGAVEHFQRENLDSLFSSFEIEDFFIWRKDAEGQFEGVNHDWRRRQRRQLIEKRYVENGSIYMFRPAVLRNTNNRLGGRIGTFAMARHKSFQIDNMEDIALCEAMIRGYGYDRRS